MQTEDVLTLFEYNHWANRRILDTAAEITPEQFLAPASYSRGGLRPTLAHILDGERSWRLLLQEGTMPFDMKEELFPALVDLTARWNVEQAEMRGYLASLKDADLPAVVRYTTSTGVKRERVRWHCLVHVVNHGTQHRSEAAALLTNFGHSPGDLDFTIYLNELASPPP
ncbi:MAG: DinB family protein [Anaerolineales bacterium]